MPFTKKDAFYQGPISFFLRTPICNLTEIYIYTHQNLLRTLLGSVGCRMTHRCALNQRRRIESVRHRCGPVERGQEEDIKERAKVSRQSLTRFDYIRAGPKLSKISKQASTPSPWVRGLRDQIQKRALQTENPSCIGSTVLRGGLRPWSQTMVSEGARPWGRGRSEFASKRLLSNRYDWKTKGPYNGNVWSWREGVGDKQPPTTAPQKPSRNVFPFS